MKDDALTLEKLNIRKDLSELKEHVGILNSKFVSEFGGDGTEGNIVRNLREAKLEFTELKKSILGNGSVGLKTDVDRIKTACKVISIIIGLGFTITGLIISYIK